MKIMAQSNSFQCLSISFYRAVQRIVRPVLFCKACFLRNAVDQGGMS